MKFLILILSINLCFAEDVKVVKKGEVVPFDGVLFSKELERQIRNDKIILEEKVRILKSINELNIEHNSVLSSRLDLYQKKTTQLIEMNGKIEKSTFIQNAGYFMAGALITGFIGYGVIQAYR